MVKSFYILVFLVFFISSVNAASVFSDSTVAKKKTPSFEKSVFVGYDFHGRLLLGFSGPQLMFKINKDTKFGPAYFPALWWDVNTGEMDTKLGVGARIDYKAYILAFNTFRVSNNLWVGSAVVGIKF